MADSGLDELDYEMTYETFMTTTDPDPNLALTYDPSAEDDRSSLYDWNSDDEIGNEDLTNESNYPNPASANTASNTVLNADTTAAEENPIEQDDLDYGATSPSPVQDPQSATAVTVVTSYEDVNEPSAVTEDEFDDSADAPDVVNDERERSVTPNNAYGPLDDLFSEFPPINPIHRLVPTIIVKYYGEEYTFVPPIKDYPGMTEYENMQPLFEDIQVAHQPLVTVLDLLRDALEIGPHYEVVLHFPHLKDLEISGTSELRTTLSSYSTAAPNSGFFSMNTLAHIYNRMHYCDGKSLMYPLIVDVSVRPSVGEVGALSQLFTAAQNGVGLASFDWSHDHQTPAPDNNAGVDHELTNTNGTGAQLEEIDETSRDAEHEVTVSESGNLASIADHSHVVNVEPEELFEEQYAGNDTVGESQDLFDANYEYQGDEEGDVFNDDAHDFENVDDEAVDEGEAAAHLDEHVEYNENEAHYQISLNTVTSETGVNYPIDLVNAETHLDLGLDEFSHENEEIVEEAVGNLEVVTAATVGVEGDNSDNLALHPLTEEPPLFDDSCEPDPNWRENWEEHCIKCPDDRYRWSDDEFTDAAPEMGVAVASTPQHANATVSSTANSTNVNHEKSTTVDNPIPTREDVTTEENSAIETSLKRSHSALEEDDDENHIDSETDQKRLRKTPEGDLIDFETFD